MNKNKVLIYAALASLLCVFMSCKTQKNIAGGSIQPLTIETLDEKITTDSFRFNTLIAKTKISFSTSAETRNASANIEMQKDQFIGVSLRLLGIEGIKIYITPDSIHILDRINQKYYARDFGYLEQLFSVSADFNTLQNLIVGDVIYYTGTKYPLAADTCTCYTLLAQQGAVKNTIQLFPTFDVMRMFVEDAQNKRTMLLTYEDYRKVDKQNFSFLRTILIDAVEKYAVDMAFTDITLNEPLSFTFSVNPKYEKISE